MRHASALTTTITAAAVAALVAACTGDITGSGAPDPGDESEADAAPGDPPRSDPDASPGDPPDASPPDDPPVTCGDQTCDPGESCANCPADCGACPESCGDGICAAAESCEVCPADCGSCGGTCGDGVCNGVGGAELCTTCDADCNTSDPVCGNGECQPGEDSLSCRTDCGPTAWPLAWEQFEDEVIALLNAERAAGTDCPTTTNEPSDPLSASDPLRLAARLHSWDMSRAGYFDHTSCNGRSPWQRAAAAGVAATGETIGGGYPSPAAMVEGWMNSQGHCAILMGAGKTLIGVGYANEGGGRWTALVR